MKRTLKAEARLLERYLGLAPDPRRDVLMDILDAAAEDACALGAEPIPTRAYEDEQQTLKD